MSRRYETANIIEQGIYDLIEVSERHSGALKLADKIIALDKPIQRLLPAQIPRRFSTQGGMYPLRWGTLKAIL